MNIIPVLISLQASFQAIGLTDALVIGAPGGLVKSVMVAGKTYKPGWKSCGWLEFAAGPFNFTVIPGLKVSQGQEITIRHPEGEVGIKPLAVDQKYLVMADMGTGTVCVITKAKVYEIIATQGERDVWFADLKELWKYNEPQEGVNLLEMGDCRIWGYYGEDLSLSQGTLSVELTDAGGKKMTISVEVR